MCWEHEDEYGNKCFDFLWNDLDVCSWTDSSIIKVLNNIGIEFKDHKSEAEAKEHFFNLLSLWHRHGMISPKNEI